DDDPITVTFNGASIQEVAATFARYSGRDIIVGPNVDVSVDAIITNQPWANAFNGILTTYGLSVAELPGGILRIDSPGELAKLDSIEVLHTMVKRLNYAKAGEMAASIAGLITPGRGSVVADTG